MSVEVFPRIVRAGADTTVYIKGRLFEKDTDYAVVCLPLQTPALQTPSRMHQPLSYEIEADGTLSVRCFFAAEQAYRLSVHEVPVVFDKPLAVLSLYALEADLFALRPYKGDLHMHSNRSDGREDPAHVAAACRRIGLDFMALTDHGQYQPSLDAIKAYEHVKADLKMFPGEEVHAPGNPLHIINFGGKYSINELFEQPGYHEKIQALAEQLGDLPDGVDRTAYAASVWAFDQIREAGGLGIFCHPYWVAISESCSQGYYIPEAMITCLFDQQPYDAFELLGGYHLHESDANNLQVARYQEERAHGKQIPIVGVSDAHGCENSDLFGWFYTIVFAPDSGLESLTHAVKDLRSVAVEALPGEVARVYGPYRLVKLALFLLRDVFPAHDVLCRREGEHMLAYYRGDETAAGQLARMQGQCGRLMQRYFGLPDK